MEENVMVKEEEEGNQQEEHLTLTWPNYIYMFADTMFEEPNFTETVGLLEMLTNDNFVPFKSHILRVLALALSPSLLRLENQSSAGEEGYGVFLNNDSDQQVSERAFELLYHWVDRHGSFGVLSTLPGYDETTIKKNMLEGISSSSIATRSSTNNNNNNNNNDQGERKRQRTSTTNKRHHYKASISDSDQIVQAIDSENKIHRCFDVWDVLAGAVSDIYNKPNKEGICISEQRGWQLFEFLIYAYEKDAAEEKNNGLSYELLRQFPKPDMGARNKLTKALNLVFQQFSSSYRQPYGNRETSFVNYDKSKRRDLVLKLLDMMLALAHFGELDLSELRLELLMRWSDLELDSFLFFITKFGQDQWYIKYSILVEYLERYSNKDEEQEEQITCNNRPVASPTKKMVSPFKMSSSQQSSSLSQTTTEENIKTNNRRLPVDVWSLDTMQRLLSKTPKDGLPKVSKPYPQDSSSIQPTVSPLSTPTQTPAQTQTQTQTPTQTPSRRPRPRARARVKGQGRAKSAEFKHAYVKLELIRIQQSLVQRLDREYTAQYRRFIRKQRDSMESNEAEVIKQVARHRRERFTVHDPESLDQLSTLEMLENSLLDITSL